MNQLILNNSFNQSQLYKNYIKNKITNNMNIKM